MGTVAAGTLDGAVEPGGPIDPERRAAVITAVGLLTDPYSERTAYPTPAWALKDPSLRSIRPAFFVAIGICTHLGCSPNGPFGPDQNAQLGDNSGFVCPCHGSTFGRCTQTCGHRPIPRFCPTFPIP